MEKTNFSIWVSLPFIMTVVLSLLLQYFVLSNTEQFTAWLSSFGLLAILVYIIIQTLTIIIAPIGGLFIYVTVLALYGPVLGLLLVYCVSTPAYLINFHLSKKFGRPLVKKLIGQKALNQVDNFVKDDGLLTLAILKVLQGGYFDYIAYASGLTKISYKHFMLINVLGGIPSLGITYTILKLSPNFTVSIILLMLLSTSLVGLSAYINHRRKHQ